jgi:Domain of unknown function (DUF5658)
MQLEMEATATRPSTATRAIVLFLILQVLDVLTTLMGLRLGATEGNSFISHLLRTGPLAGLAITKIIAALLAAVAIFLNRRRVLIFLNYWFAAVVTWNLIAIWVVKFRG